MKKQLSFLVSLFFVCACAFDISAQKITKDILLRSKEKISFTKTKYVDLPLDSLPEKDREFFKDQDFSEASEPIRVSVFRDEEVFDYDEIMIKFSLSCTAEAYKYKDIADLQEDIAKEMATVGKYASPKEKLISSYLENGTSIDGVFRKLGSLNDYDAICVDDTAILKKEVAKYPNSNRSAINKKFALSVKNGVLYLDNDASYINEVIGIVTSKSKAYSEWRKNASALCSRIRIPLNERKEFEQSLMNSFDYFKDLTKTEHQEIFKIAKSLYNSGNYYDEESIVDAAVAEFQRVRNTRLSNTTIKAICYAAVFELMQ